ncbi:uncharacterized protein BJ212DRAFT_1303534 [Suillus subaureus]|uniref:Uncharacterized protein n=1 Tax=Suillus subaureus TaxID=48587 RepID=A0A9P7DZT6_9AGAM|nr:uncharacterized protein BJ212DRAFT_1303534 [Suillus subaureus]KAG1807318.1 hypothetical protein BJ212DRAFT_1303534 [Suillus subaureus]
MSMKPGAYTVHGYGSDRTFRVQQLHILKDRALNADFVLCIGPDYTRMCPVVGRVRTAVSVEWDSAMRLWDYLGTLDDYCMSEGAVETCINCRSANAGEHQQGCECQDIHFDGQAVASDLGQRTKSSLTFLVTRMNCVDLVGGVMSGGYRRMGYHTVISGGLSSLPVTLVRELKQIRICEDRCRPLHSRAFKDPRATDQDLLLMRQIRCVDVKLLANDSAPGSNRCGQNCFADRSSSHDPWWPIKNTELAAP